MILKVIDTNKKKKISVIIIMIVSKLLFKYDNQLRIRILFIN